MPASRLSSILMLVIAAAAVTIGVAYWAAGAIGMTGGLGLAAVALVALRLAFGGRR